MHAAGTLPDLGIYKGINSRCYMSANDVVGAPGLPLGPPPACTHGPALSASAARSPRCPASVGPATCCSSLNGAAADADADADRVLPPLLQVGIGGLVYRDMRTFCFESQCSSSGALTLVLRLTGASHGLGCGCPLQLGQPRLGGAAGAPSGTAGAAVTLGPSRSHLRLTQGPCPCNRRSCRCRPHGQGALPHRRHCGRGQALPGQLQAGRHQVP
jgi:hypothetical protein